MLEAILNLSALTIRFSFALPDLIHVQYLPMFRWRLPLDLWFVRYCQRRGSKIVLTVHDLLPHDSGETYKLTFDGLYRMADAIICHSDHIQTKLETEFFVPGEKISVIPHGPFFYDISASDDEQVLRSFELEKDSVSVLWQGIIFPYKGIDLLLRSWKYVEAAMDSAWLVIAGTGSPELLDQIRGQVKDLDLKHVKLHFRFISTKELVALYRASSVIVYPYKAITTSGALATGLALGKAIVASDLPVFRELLTNGENALLVDPQNSVDLANALIELTQNRPLRERFGQKVREMNFGDESWRVIAKKTIATYQRVLTETRTH